MSARVFEELTNNYGLDPIIIINKHNFQSYEDYLENLKICDRSTIDSLYEEASYRSLDNQANEGFFLVDEENNDYLSCVVQYNCDNLIAKNLLNQNDLQRFKNKSCEILLLCSNKTNKIKGLAFDFMEHLKTYLAQKGIQYIFLVVSNLKNDDDYRVAFYNSLGFDLMNNSLMIYTSQIAGKIKKRKTRRRRKNKKRILSKRKRHH